MQITLLYSCNEWHETSSMNLKGVFSEEEALNQYLVDMKADGEITSQDFKDLKRIHQTQGRMLNYLLEGHEANTSYTNNNKKDPLKKYLKTVKCPLCKRKYVRLDFDNPDTMRCCEACGCDFNTSGDILLDPRTL